MKVEGCSKSPAHKEKVLECTESEVKSSRILFFLLLQEKTRVVQPSGSFDTK